MTPHEKIMAAFANYREDNLDLAGLLVELSSIDPNMNVSDAALYLDEYFEQGGE